ncbi:myosin-11-like, partial [Trifolium medium]|nr:myosin-11-like [Trifolium medium]
KQVSIQRLQDNGDQIQREEDECEDAKLKFDDRSLRNKLSNGDTDENTKSYFSEDVSTKPIINRTSSVSDTTLSSSDDSSGVDTPCEIGLKKTNIDRTTNQIVPVMHRATKPQNPDDNTSTSMRDFHEKSQWGWSSSSEL